MTNLYNFGVTCVDHHSKIKGYTNDYSMVYSEAIKAFEGAISKATTEGYIIVSARLFKIN